MSTPPPTPPAPGSPRPGPSRPDVGVWLWLLAGLLGTGAAAAVGASDRFSHLHPVLEALIAVFLGVLTLLAFAPWKRIFGGSPTRCEIRRLTEWLRQLGGDGQRSRLGDLKADHPDEDVTRLRHALHDALARAAAHELEARRLRRTMDHSIRRETHRATGRLQREASTDPLTGVGNRRALMEQLAALLEEAAARGSALTALVIDIDRFKQVNDHLGHDAGDRCLAFLGKILQAGLRDNDCAFRHGGDEFVVVMPGATSAIGAKVAARIVSLFSQMAWPHEDLPRPTLSIGVAAVPAGGTETPEALIHRADEAMYAAKRAGRARITTSREAA